MSAEKWSPKMKPLNEIFDITYGNKFDLNKLTKLPINEGGVNFVGRSGQNNGVSCSVDLVEGVTPYEGGLITVALGGSLLSAFIQEAAFYTAQNVAILKPKKALSFSQKLFYCIAIRHNKFRYSAFGREANRTLKTLLVPSTSDLPNWITEVEEQPITNLEKAAHSTKTKQLLVNKWHPFELQSIFDIRKGQRLTKADMLTGNTPYVGASDANNGVTAYIGQPPTHKENTITISYNGSVAEAFYQPQPFWASDDVNVLYPINFEISPSVALFICTVIRLEKYRFNYGRKWHLDRMREALIKLPVTRAKKLDLVYMENFIKTLSYSSQI